MRVRIFFASENKLNHEINKESFFYLQSNKEIKPTGTAPSLKQSTRKLRMPLANILQSIKPPPTGGLADITIHSCATPPQHRRRLFNPKNLRSPFGHRQSNSVGCVQDNNLSGMSMTQCSFFSFSNKENLIENKNIINQTHTFPFCFNPLLTLS